jgi:hypothetical protein
MQEVTLYGGVVVRVRPTPPHVWRRFQAEARAELPPEPQLPTRQAKGAAGNVETMPADEGTPEYEAWLAQWNVWAQDNQAALNLINEHWRGLMLDYAIVEWRQPGGDWVSEPPEDWEYPAALSRAGLNPGDNRRLDYIHLELLTTPAAVELVTVAATITDLAEEEVEAQMRGFLPPAGQGRGTAESAPAVGRVGHDIPGGGTGGESAGDWLRRLVRAIKGSTGSGTSG